MKNFKTLKINDVVIRKLKPNDCEQFYFNVASNEQLYLFLPYKHHSSQEVTMAYIKEYTESYKKDIFDCSFVLQEYSTKKIIGYLQCYEKAFEVAGQVYLRIILNNEYWNMGIATNVISLFSRYLIKKQGVNRVGLVFDSSHASMQKVAKKAGFYFEGILRDCGYTNKNHTCDCMVYSLIRKDLD